MTEDDINNRIQDLKDTRIRFNREVDMMLDELKDKLKSYPQPWMPDKFKI